LGDGAVVEWALPDGRAAEGDAGHHDAEHEGVARVQRHFSHLLGGDDTGAGGSLRFQHGRFRGDFDGFGHGADFEADVDTGDLADFQDDILADVLLEPGHRHGHPVVAGTQASTSLAAGRVIPPGGVKGQTLLLIRGGPDGEGCYNRSGS
jgi:hypothetical protein